MNKYCFRVPLLVLALSACDRRLAPPAPAPPVSPEGVGRLSLLERLGQEAGQRPGARPSAEAVAAALAGKGLPLERWKQVLASTIGARFCMAGQTARGNVVSVCEFADADQAERGLSYSRQTFDRLIPHRSLQRRAGTLLTVTRPDSASTEGEAQAISAIFNAIPARL